MLGSCVPVKGMMSKRTVGVVELINKMQKIHIDLSPEGEVNSGGFIL